VEAVSFNREPVSVGELGGRIVDKWHELDINNNRRIYFGYMKTVINIKADKDVKEHAQKLAKELGVPLSTIINAYLKDFIRNRSVNLSAAPRMSRQLESLIGRVEKDIAAGKNMSGPFSSADEVISHLDNL
jgi:addiction module RelB/DinJ family antitoxin